MHLDSSAKLKIQELIPVDSKFLLRITVSAGGCNGFQHEFDLCDQLHEDDTILNNSVVIDASSLEFLNNSTLFYRSSLGGSGFEIQIPEATSSCGCGKSWNL
jgi:iron-sulfur cluster assembly accessory protein